MEIINIKVGYLRANCYLVINNNKLLIIDPGSEFEKIDSTIKELKAKPVGIIVTHNHFDHVGEVDKFIEKYDLDVCSYYNKIIFNDFNYEIIDTKGHTSDSITIYFKEDNTMFTGDFLFKETIGRTDLDTGSDIEMNKSLNLIKKYPLSTIIYPGHGDSTTLENELKNNIYLSKN